MRILRHVTTGRVKTIQAWIKYYEKTHENGLIPCDEYVKRLIRNGELVMVKHRG